MLFPTIVVVMTRLMTKHDKHIHPIEKYTDKKKKEKRKEWRKSDLIMTWKFKREKKQIGKEMEAKENVYL